MEHTLGIHTMQKNRGLIFIMSYLLCHDMIFIMSCKKQRSDISYVIFIMS